MRGLPRNGAITSIVVFVFLLSLLLLEPRAYWDCHKTFFSLTPMAKKIQSAKFADGLVGSCGRI